MLILTVRVMMLVVHGSVFTSQIKDYDNFKFNDTSCDFCIIQTRLQLPTKRQHCQPEDINCHIPW